MKAYSALLAIRANQKDLYARSDPIEPGTPTAPTTPPTGSDRTEPIAQLRLDEIQVDTSNLSTVLGSGGYGAFAVRVARSQLTARSRQCVRWQMPFHRRGREDYQGL